MSVINDSRSAAFRRHCAPVQAPLERPAYHLRHDPPAHRVQLAVETFQRHMTDEGWQIQLGLEKAGWEMYGAKLPNGETDVDKILMATQPTSVIVQDKREWDPTMPGCFDKQIAFQNVDVLTRWPNVFRLAIFRDAHQRWAYQRDFHEQLGAHGWIILYHPQIICELAPWVRREDLIRTYHSIDPEMVPEYSPERQREALISGADNGTVYPFRQAVFNARICERLPHPGYHAMGTCTPTFLKVLSQFKVSVCTTSIFGYALRKIIESVAAGCVVITDLPEGDVLPEIDECLIRVPPNIPMHELRLLIRHQCMTYNPERQEHFARIACDFYDWRRLGLKLGRDIERHRYGQQLESVVEVKPSPEIDWREEFGQMLGWRGLTGLAVEIGTDRGDFAKAFLDRWRGEKLFCIDPWDNTAPGWTGLRPDGTPDASGDGRLWKDSDRAKDHVLARAKLQGSHPGRFRLMQMTSREAIPTFADDSLAFGNIDGNHFYDYVAEDIALLWPKIRSGGILAGHDWNGPWQEEVRPAVLNHAAQYGLPVWTVAGDRISGTASWYLEKP